MQKITDKTEKIETETKLDWEDIKPIEFERILNLYGMKKVSYCSLCKKTKGWWYNVLIRKNFLSYMDIKKLADKIGTDTFNSLLTKVRSAEK
jgi:hypothetical protein